LIADGVLENFLHNSYTARRAGSRSTGSALRSARSLPGVGAQVLVLEPGTRSFEELIGSIDHGLLVNSFAGLHSGVNPTSGDFSVGADGLLIRNGELAGPVREITLASTIQRMLSDLAEVGGDGEWLPGGDYLASLVVPDVSMSGA
jgi:PmbA protein